MDKEINVLFKVMGSPEIGLGHVMRSLEQANEIKKDLKGKIFFHCNEKVVEKIKDKYTAFTTNENVDVHKDIADKISRYDIDILIIDQIEENMELCKSTKLKKPEILTVALDYFNYENRYLDVIINLYNHNLNVPDPNSEFMGGYYEGIKYAIIRDSFKKYIGREKRIGKNINEILITFGGSDLKGNTIKVLNLLNKMADTAKVNVVIGPMFKNEDRIIEIAKIRDEYEIYREVENMEDLIFSADLGFIGSGTTLMEFCALGTPAIVMPQNENEERFASIFERNNAIHVLKEYHSMGKKMSATKKVFGSEEIREEMSSCQKQLIDGNGKKRIKKIILSKAKLE